MPWWDATAFHAAGYDYLHEGQDYSFTPLEGGRQAYGAIVPVLLEDAAWDDPHQRVVLVYREPVSQAESYFHYCRKHPDPRFSRSGGRCLEEMSFADYLFELALPSYAKLFVTYQQMATCLPDRVGLVAYERLAHSPVETLAAILRFLAGGRCVDRI